MIQVRRALFSAYDKEGLLPLAREVARWGGEILSSGGTAEFLREAGLKVVSVEERTGVGSLFGGRVKTLHPRIHGGILYRRDVAQDLKEARENAIEAIDLVVVNLYPFADALARNAGEEDQVEMIDIGGPALVRAAAKNHRHVGVVTLARDYEPVRLALEENAGSLPRPFCRDLAVRAFAVTAEYDAAIAGWMGSRGAPRTVSAAELPESWRVAAPLRRKLRYGENPSQLGGLYGEGEAFPFNLEQLHGKELSYNNLLDLACGRDVIAEFGGAGVAVVVKHGIPCGVAAGEDLAATYRRARDADSLSAFGGVVIVDREVDAETAEALNESFLEAVLAPAYTNDALERLARKKSRIVLRCPADSLLAPLSGLRGRFAGSGFLLQTAMPSGLGESEWKLVTRQAADSTQEADLRLGWKVLKHVRSNGVLLAKEGRTVGIGSGQCSRIDSVEAAIRKAGREGHDLTGSILVSDAFFPFRDSIDRAAACGVRAVLQPGGSVRDDESIAACDEHGIAMYLNGARVFSHG